MDSQDINPFHVGDEVVFAPDDRTIGWIWPSLDSLRIHPGDYGIVTEVLDDLIFIEDGRGGISWHCWKVASLDNISEVQARWKDLESRELRRRDKYHIAT